MVYIRWDFPDLSCLHEVKSLHDPGHASTIWGFILIAIHGSTSKWFERFDYSYQITNTEVPMGGIDRGGGTPIRVKCREYNYIQCGWHQRFHLEFALKPQRDFPRGGKIPVP